MFIMMNHKNGKGDDGVKADGEFRSRLEELLWDYENEVLQAKHSGLLTESTARTYLLHANNFVKWCKDDFVPGGRNQGKQD